MNHQSLRRIEQVLTGRATSDGAGVSLTRYLYGPQLQQRLDPFLMLDAFGSDDPGQYIAGFPDHPHRGFETITYMLEGRMLHRDSAGNQGLLDSGDLQWMCAGKGVIHSEMPQQVAGRMEGFQLWLNLPAADKLCEPWYQDIAADQVPVLTTDNGSRISVVAGHSHGVAGIIQRPRTEPLYLDVSQPANSREQHSIAAGHNAFIQLYRGRLSINGQSVAAPTMLILDNPDGSTAVEIEAHSDCRYLVVAGQPLNEPIEQHGPFVMNSKEQIYQAIQDFRNGLMG
ncbi:MAG: pirin family protein [Hydrogenophaga sp.]